MKSIDNFNYVTSVVHHADVPGRRARSSRSTSCRSGRRSLAQLNPLYHCVQLVRDAVFGFEGWIDLLHVAYWSASRCVMWRLAIWRMDASA